MQLLRTHSSNTVAHFLLIPFFLDNSLAKFSSYALSRPKFWRLYDTFKALEPDKFAFYFFQIARLTGELLSLAFCLCLPLK